MAKKINYQNYLRLIGIALFAYIFFFKINISDLFSVFEKVNLVYFFASVALLPISIIIGAYKWGILLNYGREKTAFGKIILAQLGGLFWGVITPGRLGEFYKAKYLSDESQISAASAFSASIVDRLMDVAVTALVGVFAIFFLLSGRVKDSLFIPFLIVVILLSLGILLLLFSLRRKFLEEVLLKISGAFRLSAGARLFIGEFFKSVRAFNFLTFLKVAGLSLLSYFFSVFIYFLLALSLGIAVSFADLFFVNALVFIVLLAPLTFFGLGTREAAYIFLLSLFKIAATESVAFSLLIFFSGILMCLPGGIVFFKKTGKKPASFDPN